MKGMSAQRFSGKLPETNNYFCQRNQRGFRVISRGDEETRGYCQWNEETIDILKKYRRLLLLVMPK
jgi:hypothetical protein